MNSPARRPLPTGGTYGFKVPSQDRFARTDGRPQRKKPLTRNIEVASLLPDLTVAYKTVRVPQWPAFEHAAAAFARGTVVQSVDGPIAVEDLTPGDYIETSRGPQPVLWIASTQLAPGRAGAGSSLTHLTRITADGLGPARPERDVLLGPGARIKRMRLGEDPCGVLYPVADFVDGETAFDVTPPSPVQLFHLRFGRHATFSIGGLEVESYHPGENMDETLSDAARSCFLTLFPGLRSLSQFGPLTVSRASQDRIDAATVA